MADTANNSRSNADANSLENKVGIHIKRFITGLPAVPTLIGVILGFALCSILGRVTASAFNFSRFERFFRAIQPQGSFYPTASELVSHVRRKIPKNKILVLVGGASYFRGTGQNPDELWTLELQNLLGDEYRVVNFAIDQAGITDFAGAAFQVLAREYPRMIYLSNMGASLNGGDGVDGGETYRYVFWDAYYKDMLKGDKVWQEDVKLRRSAELKTLPGLELHLGKYIDSYTYACDLWNYIGYRYLMTIWSDSTVGSTFLNRRSYTDAIDPNFAQQQIATRSDKEYTKTMEERNKDYFQHGTYIDKDGQVKLWIDSWNNASDQINHLFPADLHKKCLMIILHGNHYFMKSLTASDWKRYDLMYKTSLEICQKVGYPAIEVGADFSADDYIDAGHFMASGGRKIAHHVADKIKEIVK
jgi:hypothetical protein